MALQSIVQYHKDLVAISSTRIMFGSGDENMFSNNNYKTPICYSYFLTCVCVFTGMEHTTRADTLQFTNEPNSTIYVRNSIPFLVPCEATGDDPLEVHWRNESVLNSRVVINTTNKGLWFMRGVQPLRSPKVHRVGIFRCMATNTAGVVMSKKFELNFICKYKICVFITAASGIAHTSHTYFLWFGNYINSRLSVPCFLIDEQFRIPSYCAVYTNVYHSIYWGNNFCVNHRGLKCIAYPHGIYLFKDLIFCGQKKLFK